MLRDRRSRSRRGSAAGSEVPRYLKKFAADNREKMTPAQSFLLGCLRKEDPGERIFTEHAVDMGPGAIVDIFFPDLKIAVEVDGPSHKGKEQADAARDRALKATYGIETVRCTNQEVFFHRRLVLQRIATKIAPRTNVGRTR